MTGWIGPVGGLMVAHGGALALGGLGVVGTAPIALMEGEELGAVLFVGLVGLSWIAVGAAQLGCGLGVMNKRLRIAALITLAAGFVVTLPLCGCVPTMVTTVLGLVVLTNHEVVAAFADAG
jgi:hypothetical protein